MLRPREFPPQLARNKRKSAPKGTVRYGYYGLGLCLPMVIRVMGKWFLGVNRNRGNKGNNGISKNKRIISKIPFLGEEGRFYMGYIVKGVRHQRARVERERERSILAKRAKVRQCADGKAGVQRSLNWARGYIPGQSVRFL